MKRIFLAVLAAATLSSAAAFAADVATGPFLSPLFADNMVLQRGVAASVWGWTDPGAAVTLEMNGKRARAVAGADGRWMAKLGSMPAGGPYTLTVNGPRNVVLHNVLVGDVWVCSGQSNMEFGIGNGINAAGEIAAANYPQIRLFTVGKKIATVPEKTLPPPRADLASQWSVCTPETVSTGGWNGFTAVGYFFGRYLHQKLGVPIGLIHTSWGGTPAEAWTSAGSLKTMKDYAPAVEQIEQAAAEQAGGGGEYTAHLAAWWARNDPGSAHGIGWADPAMETAAWEPMTLPTNWEVAGLPGFDGVVWFRKDVVLPDDAAGKEAVLHLGPIDDRDTTWINGVQVGGLDVWDTPRDYHVPAGVLKAGRNVIAVRVLDTGGNGGIYGKPEQMVLEVPGDQPLSLAGPWHYKVGVALAKTTPFPQQIDNNPNVPTVLYNGMIAPLLPFAIKGAIWYQGESNAGKAYQYRTLLPTMIRDWRAQWGEGEFPFLIVQLANFMQTPAQPAEDPWAELREAQLMTSQSVPHTGLAVTIDIGDANDIHPKDKQDVGKRLALAALATVYHQNVEYAGPTYRSMTLEGSQIRLRFSHAGGGLVAKGGNPLKGFAIAGADGHFAWANAAIDGDTVIVSSPQVAHPVAVRYAWAANPVCNLFNRSDLPASPFRTDTWPGITVNAH